MQHVFDADLEYVDDQAPGVHSEDRTDEYIGRGIGRITGDGITGEKVFPN
jgi:hypothetical protein